MLEIIGVGLILTTLVYFITPKSFRKLKVLIKGSINSKVDDLSNTPEGAKAIYKGTIEKIQIKYDETLAKSLNLLAKIKEYEDRINENNKIISNIELKCEELVKENEIDSARLLSNKRSKLLALNKNYTKIVEDFTKMHIKLKKLTETYKGEIEKLKYDMELVISKIYYNQEMQTYYIDKDKYGNNNSQVKELLKNVKDIEYKIMATEETFENNDSDEEKVKKLLKEANDESPDEFLESLREVIKEKEEKINIKLLEESK